MTGPTGAGKGEQVNIVACPDGPLLVRGEVEILTPSGDPIPRRRKTVALCRCGASTIKPYCDGSHKIIGFRTEPAEPSEQAEQAEQAEPVAPAEPDTS